MSLTAFSATFLRAECVDVRRRMQCERGLRTTSDGGTFIQMTVLEMKIAIIHCLPSEWRVGRHV